MTRMTRKRAEALVKKKWSHIGTEEYISVDYLCSSMPPSLRKDWNAYWLKINTIRYYAMGMYFEGYNPYPKELDFLRLLTVHLFIQHTYKD